MIYSVSSISPSYPILNRSSRSSPAAIFIDLARNGMKFCPIPRGMGWWTENLVPLLSRGSQYWQALSTSCVYHTQMQRIYSVILISLYVEINRVRIEILNWLSYKSDCLKSKEGQRQANIYGKEEGILGEAEYHIRRPMPSITAGASPTPRHEGWWRPMGAASHRPHARSLRPSGAVSSQTPHKPSGQIPCQHYTGAIVP